MCKEQMEIHLSNRPDNVLPLSILVIYDNLKIFLIYMVILFQNELEMNLHL